MFHITCTKKKSKSMDEYTVSATPIMTLQKIQTNMSSKNWRSMTSNKKYHVRMWNDDCIWKRSALIVGIYPPKSVCLSIWVLLSDMDSSSLPGGTETADPCFLIAKKPYLEMSLYLCSQKHILERKEVRDCHQNICNIVIQLTEVAKWRMYISVI